METERLTDWLWCLRTPAVQAYAVRERDGFNLIDTSLAGEEPAIVAALAGIDGAAPDDARVYELASGGKAPPAPPVQVQVRVRPGDRLAWEHPPEVVAAPGHTPGSIAFWFERERVLVAGDAIAIVSGRPVSGVFNVDLARADETFARLAALDPEIACFGHGEPLRAAAGTTPGGPLP